MIKADHALPIAGSIKARGAFYEVLMHAESLALSAGVIQEHHDRSKLAGERARSFFSQHEISVGSTGNLGLESESLRQLWASRRLCTCHRRRSRGKKSDCARGGSPSSNTVVTSGVAVANGREQAQQNPLCYFVDDEDSRLLFLGYTTAAPRLARQLVTAGIAVDASHPLFVYLPCGVGGSPGGITLGLRHLFGDRVHCFFAEPVASPGMLVRLAAREDRPISVREIGLDNRTEADGLAVAPSIRLRGAADALAGFRDLHRAG